MAYKKFLGAASPALMIVIAIFLLTSGASAAGKYISLYKFTGGTYGTSPSGLILGQDGKLYGTTWNGGNVKQCDGRGCGMVFALAKNADGNWAESVLYTFSGGNDGAGPANLVFDQAGNLYGTAGSGGDLNYCGGYGCGAIFKLVPNPDGSWTKSQLYAFTSYSDGDDPNNLIIDTAGNLYGTTYYGGNPAYCNGSGCGTAFKLTPNPDGSWTESLLYAFTGAKYGRNPSGLVLDGAGNLYGTLEGAGGRHGSGVIYKLTSNPDGSWTESVLHSFCSLPSCKDGWGPYGGLIFDAAGNLYGTTFYGGGHKDSGVAYELTPNPDGSWTETVLHRFCSSVNCPDGRHSYAGLTLDTAGSLYGTTSSGGDLNYCGGYGCGLVFKLAPTSGGRWKETVLHRFQGHPGSNPVEGVIFDAAGNLYGTTPGYNSSRTGGSVFEITP